MAAAEYSTEVMADAPKAYWKCQEASGFPQDSSGFGFHTTVVDTPVNTYHYAGQAAMGDYAIEYGSGGRHRTTSIPSSATANLSMECWLNLGSTPGSNQPFMAWDNSKLQIFANSSRKFLYVIAGVGFGSQSVAALTLDTWYHIVVTRGASDWKYYINGASDTTFAGNHSPSGYGTISYFTGGAMTARTAHVAFYATELSAARIAAHYAAASASAGPAFVPRVIATY